MNPNASHDRLKILWKARARALAVLAKRHNEEFLELRAEEVRKLGGGEVRPKQGRPPAPKE